MTREDKELSLGELCWPEETSDKTWEGGYIAAIEKACEWLKDHADNYTWYDETEGESGMTDDFIKEFRLMMEKQL